MEDPKLHIDLVLLDTEMPGDDFWLQRVVKTSEDHRKGLAVIFLGTNPDERILKRAIPSNLKGYLLKDEICYSLAWAVALAAEGKWVMTDGIEKMFSGSKYFFPNNYVVLNGKNSTAYLSPHMGVAARLAFFFSMERREIADELDISEDWSYGLVSDLYKEIGMDELLSGETPPHEYLRSYKIISKHLDTIMTELEKSKIGRKAGAPNKARDIETLAFHLLTLPEIRSS